MMTFRELYSASFVRELLNNIELNNWLVLSTGELLGGDKWQAGNS